MKDVLSWLGHGALSLLLFCFIGLPLGLGGVSNWAVIAAMFPAGIYYGREVIDQRRNIYEELKAAGMSGEDARESADHPKHLFFIGWDLDGIMDVLTPWAVLAGAATWFSLA